MRFDELNKELTKLNNGEELSMYKIASILGTHTSKIKYRKDNNSHFSYEEIQKLYKYFNEICNKSLGYSYSINLEKPIVDNIGEMSKPIGCTGDCRTCKNARILAQQVEIEYMEELPESERLPEITSKYEDLETIVNHWHRQPENLRIIPMQGDNLSTYWYPCKNRDLLIIDIGSKVAAREGVYVYSAHNNTMLFVGKLNQLMDGTIRIEKFEASGEVTEKLVSPEKQKEVDFRILGRLVKNASLSL